MSAAAGDPGERFSLAGKVALITGGSRGLGRQMALGFAEAGADVIVASRKLEACRAVVEEVEKLGRRGEAIAVNVSHWEELDGLVDDAYAAFGRVDVLVNNAGMSPLYPDLAAVTEALWDKVLGVNLKGPFRLTALVGPRMVASGGGSIINISTTGSIRPAPFMLPYDAAKAGLNALTVGFAHAYGPAVRVNCIMAGPFLTDVTAGWDLESFEEQAKQRFALGRAGQPEEIVGTALYLASSASSFTTGAVVRVDGGLP